MRLFAILAMFTLLVAAASADPLQTVVLDVRNMTCPVCPVTVKKALEKVSGVADAKVDLAHKTATVAFDPGKTNTDALVKATTNAGYPSAIRP